MKITVCVEGGKPRVFTGIKKHIANLYVSMMSSTNLNEVKIKIEEEPHEIITRLDFQAGEA